MTNWLKTHWAWLVAALAAILTVLLRRKPQPIGVPPAVVEAQIDAAVAKKEVEHAQQEVQKIESQPELPTNLDSLADELTRRGL